MSPIRWVAAAVIAAAVVLLLMDQMKLAMGLTIASVALTFVDNYRERNR